MLIIISLPWFLLHRAFTLFLLIVLFCFFFGLCLLALSFALYFWWMGSILDFIVGFFFFLLPLPWLLCLMNLAKVSSLTTWVLTNEVPKKWTHNLSPDTVKTIGEHSSKYEDQMKTRLFHSLFPTGWSNNYSSDM